MAFCRVVLILYAVVSTTAQRERCVILDDPENTVCRELPDRNSNHTLPLRYQGIEFNSNANSAIISNLNIGVSRPTVCLQAVQFVSCLISNMPCNNENNRPLRICNESCQAFNQLMANTVCDDFNQRVLNFSTIPTFNPLREVYSNFDCSNTSTYYFGTRQFDDTKCTSIFPMEQEDDILSGVYDDATTTTTETVPASTTPTVIVIAISVGVVGLVLVVGAFVVCMILLFCLIRRRKKRKNARHVNPVLNGKPVKDNDEVISLEKHYVNQDEILTQNDRHDYKKLFASKVIRYESLQLGECIGEGAFGKVLKGKLMTGEEEQKVAIKTLKNFSSQDSRKEFFAESLIMKDFHHPNVLGLLGVVFDSPDGVPYLVLPFMELGNLKDYLKSKRVHVTNFDTLPKDMGESDLMRMSVEIAKGMEYLAHNRFVHRDLAARNCMVSETLQIKVGDFGLARDVYSSDYYKASQNAKLPVKWMPPETLHDAVSNERTDVWAYGVTCWEVFSLGRTPYPGVPNYDVLKFITEGGRLEKPTLCPIEMYEVLEKCWNETSKERPLFKEIIRLVDTVYSNMTYYY